MDNHLRTGLWRITAATLGMALLVLSGGSVLAITNGEIDTTGQFPSVGMIILQTPTGDALRWCSGTLIHERVFLTAAHCSEPLETLMGTWDVFVSFDLDPLSNFASWRVVTEVFTHPEWRGPWHANSHDVGALVLAEAANDIPVAALPPVVDYLDELKAAHKLTHGPDGTDLPRAGYGWTDGWPPPALQPNSVRRFTNGKYSGVLKLRLVVLGNENLDAGSVCYWDSGSPVFYEDEDGNRYIVATTSDADEVCRSISMNYRIDIQEAQDFIVSVFGSLD